MLPRPALAHLPAEDLGAEEIAGEVDRQHRVPFGQRQIFQPARPQHRRGVDQHAAGSERLFDGFGRGGDALDIRGVAAFDDSVAGYVEQFRLRYLKAALVEIDRRDTGAGAGEAQRHGAADAATAPRHHADAAGQAQPVGGGLFGHDGVLRCNDTAA